MLGGGMSINIHQKSPTNFLQASIYGGYMDFQNTMESPYQTFILGTAVRAKLPISKTVNGRWELATYHSTQTTSFWGGSYLLQLNFRTHKNLFFNITHQLYYNHLTPETIEQLNSELLFGLQFSF